MQAWMGGWYWGSPTLPSPSLRDPHSQLTSQLPFIVL